MKNLVTSQWLKDNINKENLVIVDCRFNLMDKEYGKRSYEECHIKGSGRVDIETELSSSQKEHGGRHPLPEIEELRKTFESIGISNDSIVVAYDEGDLAGPSRLWWILKYIGHENTYILKDGINEFKAIGGEVTNEKSNISKGNLDININQDMKVDMEYVKARLHKENIAIVDSRETQRYNGEFEPVDKKCGHIPSALNYFWMEIFNKKESKLELKAESELKKHFKQLYKYDDIIVYCGSGITACPNSLALTEAGIKHKVYLGSFSDWISYDDNEVDIINK